ncbi:unnamed protein product, partial [Ixodes hexagonus]
LWFLETAFHRRLDSRQACAIESASLHNPKFRVELLTTADLSTECGYVRPLTRLPNFRWTNINLSTIFHSMPLEHWYESMIWKRGLNPVQDLSDGLRYTVLWKQGGVYLDLDVISTRSLSGLKNSAVYETGTTPANGILIFDKGHDFLWNLQRTCAKVYNTSTFGSCGPSLMRRVSKSKLSKNMTFLNASSFLAVSYHEFKWLIEPECADLVFEKVRYSYGVHVWSRVPLAVRHGSAYDILARTNCPMVYELMK